MGELSFEEFVRYPNRALERIHRQGTPPPLEELAGWEYCGLNRPPYFALVGIRKFIKGFYVPLGGEAAAKECIAGFNVLAIQNGISGEWLARRDDENPRRFGFFSVAPTRVGSSWEQYPNAVLLDYGAAERNARVDPSRLIRDFIVQVEPGSSEVLLGKALLALLPSRGVFSNYFLLRRRRPHDWRA